MTQATSIIDDARRYATNKLGEIASTAGGYVNSLTNLTEGSATLEPESVKEVSPTVPTVWASTKPEYNAPNFDGPTTKPSGPPVLQDIENLAETMIGDEPVNTAVKPMYEMPEKPERLEPFDGNLPAVDTTMRLPPDPQWGNFQEPDWYSYREVPDAEYTPPSFTAVTRPVNGLRDPDLVKQHQDAYQTGKEYHQFVESYVDGMLGRLTDFYGQLGARLESYMQGGTGLAPAVEDAIYARARSKNDAEARRVRDQAMADAATRGFTMPNGALLSATQQARQAGADANATAAREIVTMQAELEQKNMQFAMTAYSAMRGAIVSASMSYVQTLVQINGQAVEYANALTNQMMQLFDAQVKQYQIEVSMIDYDIKYTDSLLRGELGKLQLYSAQMEGEKTKATMNQSMASVYQSQLESNQRLATMYKTKVDALVEKKRIERLKIELFQAEVQAFEAKSRATESEWRGFTAAISGEESKVRAYQSEIAAFSAEVESFKAIAEAKKVGLIETKARNDAQLATYEQHIKLAATEIQENLGVFREKLALEEKKGVDWRWEQQRVASENEAALAAKRQMDAVALQSAKQQFDGEIEKFKAQLMLATPITELGTKHLNALANVAASSLAGLNSLAVEYASE